VNPRYLSHLFPPYNLPFTTLYDPKGGIRVNLFTTKSTHPGPSRTSSPLHEIPLGALAAGRPRRRHHLRAPNFPPERRGVLRERERQCDFHRAGGVEVGGGAVRGDCGGGWRWYVLFLSLSPLSHVRFSPIHVAISWRYSLFPRNAHNQHKTNTTPPNHQTCSSSAPATSPPQWATPPPTIPPSEPPPHASATPPIATENSRGISRRMRRLVRLSFFLSLHLPFTRISYVEYKTCFY